MSGSVSVLLIGLFWQIAPVVAQPEVIPQKVVYQRDVPKNVAQAASHEAGARHLFWGTFVTKTGASPIGIQLYETPSGVTLGVWQKGAKRFVRVNTVPRVYGYVFQRDAKFSADFYWLDRVQKTMPILVINQISADKLYQESTVVSWPSGWSSQPTIQCFTQGSTGTQMQTFSVSYNASDQLELTSASGDITGTIETYKWDGKRFSVVKTTTYGTP